MNTIHEIERRAPGAWINRAIRHLGQHADDDTLRAIVILLAALRETSR